MSGFWDKEQPSEWETFSESLEDAAQQVLDQMDEDEEDEYEDEYEEEDYMTDYEPRKKKVAYKLDGRESSVVNDAMIRLEQARLYDMLIKHDMFKGVKAHPQALANVQHEFKTYIVKRLEILLGIRKEEKEKPKELVVESSFNEMETTFLKMLAKRGTDGHSENSEPVYLTSIETESDEDDNEGEVANYQNMQLSSPNYSTLAPLDYEDEEEEPAPKPKKRVAKPKAPAPKKAAIKKKPAAKKTVKKSTQAKKPVAPKPEASATSQKPKKVKNTSAKTNRKGLISNAEAERLAREDIERMKGRKPVEEMSAKELLEANKRINTTTNRERPAGALPMPNDAQIGMHYQMQQSNRTADPKAGTFNVLLTKVLNDAQNR